MIVRLATEKDVPAITEIYNEAIKTTVATFDTETKTVENRMIWFSQHSEKLPVWVCEDNGTVIGWASISLWSDRCAYSGTIENSVYIFQKYRGKGAGKALMEVLMKFVRANHYRTVLARISDGNEASIKLHQKYGFESIGTMRSVGFKFDRWIDVNLMQILL